MTPERIAAIKARCEKASLNWKAEEGWDGADLRLFLVRGARDGIKFGRDAQAWDDVRFAAHARDDVPDLLAEVERLAEEIERARTYTGLEWYGCPLCTYKDGALVQSCTMHAQINFQAKEIEARDSVIETLTFQVAELDRDAGGVRSALAERNREIEEKNREIEKLRADRELLQSTYPGSEEIAALKADEQRWQAGCKHAEAERDEARGHANSFEESLTAAYDTIEALQSERDRLRKRLAELPGSLQHLSDLAAEISKYAWNNLPHKELWDKFDSIVRALVAEAAKEKEKL